MDVVWEYFIKLSALQLIVQVAALVLTHFQKGPNAVIAGLRFVLGLTGDNSPKKKHIEESRWLSYLLNAIAAWWTVRHWLSNEETEAEAGWLWALARWVLAITVTVLVPLAFRWTSLFYLIKIYDGGKGIGLNLYYRGWRKFGVDWHKFLVCQDPKTGRPLAPEQQYWINRPHIDLPDYNLHHWPWAQTDSHEDMVRKKAAAEEGRRERDERRAQKRARREETLRLRGTASPAGSPGDASPVPPATPDVMHPTAGAAVSASASPIDAEEDLSGLF